MSSLCAEHISSLTPYPPGKPIEEVQRELGVADCIKLASNENPMGPSPRAVEAMREAATKLHVYPDGGGYYLKGALSERFGFDRSQIMLGNGSNEMLVLLIHAVASVPGRNIVTSRSTFVVYKLVSQAYGVEFRETPLDAGYGYDLDAMLEQVDDNTGLVFIANPNNPTGTYVSAEALERFITAVDEKVSDPPLIVLDEAYYEYVDAPDYPDGLSWVRRRPRTVVTRTFSKAYGLAGIRLGYGFAEQEVCDIYNRIRQPFNVNSLGLVAGLAALDDGAYLEEVVRTNKAGMAVLGEALAARGAKVIPSQTNFVLADFGFDTGELYQALMRRGVIVRPMAGYDLPTTVRITIGTPAQNERCIAALDASLQELGKA